MLQKALGFAGLFRCVPQMEADMAKQYRKLQKKIHPKTPKPTPKPKVGKDYFLLGIIAFTAIILLIGWQRFDGTNIALYLLLLSSLGITYVRRHAKLTEQQDVWLERAGLTTTVMALVLFVIVFYHQYIA